MDSANEGRPAAVRLRGPGCLAIIALICGALGIWPVAIVAGAVAFAAARKRGGDLFVPLVAIGLGIGGLALETVLVLMYWEQDIPAREKAVVAELASIAAAQEEFRGKAWVDQDGDGRGEYGLLSELAGGRPFRKHGGFSEPGAGDGLISRVFRNVSEKGYIEKYGYYFMVFLPGASWADAIPDSVDLKPGSRDFADGQERFWRVFAWPAVKDGTGRTVFFIDQSGAIYRSDNAVQGYDGWTKMPAPWDVNDSVSPNPRSLDAAKAWTAGGRPAGGGIWKRQNPEEGGKR